MPEVESEVATHGRPEAARAAAQEVARQRARWLSAVRDAAERAPSLEDGLRAALARVCAHLGWQAGRVEFASITGDLASRTIWHLEDGQELDRFRALAELRRDARESGLARRAINEGTPCSAILAGKEAGASRVRAVYAFPALFNRRPMAALEFFSEDARQQPQELLEAVAQCCAELGALFAKKPAEETLRHAERRYRELFESNADGLLVLDPDLGTVLEANPRACEVFGRTRAELVGLRLETLWGDPARARTALNQACRFELTVAQPHGPELAAEVTASAVLYLGRRAVLIHAREVPRIARTAEPRDPPLRGLDEPALLRAALYDPVTGLANRTLLRDRLLLAHARTKGREGGPHAVLVIDLDRFGLVNDSLGHRAGDELLHQVARRLEACRRSGDTVARLGGDDFALLIENARDDEDAVQVAERIHRALATPFLIAGHEVWMAARVGIARSLGDAGPEAVLQNASTALDRARQRGIRQAVFDASMHEQALASLRLGADLRRALERGQLVLHHQPVLWLSTGKARGVEALVRWNHPQRGLLPPGDFIPHAEQSGLVVPLGSYVLRRACAEIAGLGAPLTVSINVSAMQLLHPGLYQDVTETLQQTGLPPERLKLELTETMLVEAGPAAVAVLVRLRELGVRISIDDFGTGYSSLSYLHELPIDELKIDASFVRSMLSSPRLAKVVQSILLLGQGLGIEVVAEGVETEEQAAALRGMGCELAQGFLFARPIPLDDLSAWLSRTA